MRSPHHRCSASSTVHGLRWEGEEPTVQAGDAPPAGLIRIIAGTGSEHKPILLISIFVLFLSYIPSSNALYWRHFRHQLAGGRVRASTIIDGVGSTVVGGKFPCPSPSSSASYGRDRRLRRGQGRRSPVPYPSRNVSKNGVQAIDFYVRAHVVRAIDFDGPGAPAGHGPGRDHDHEVTGRDGGLAQRDALGGARRSTGVAQPAGA